MTTSPVPFDRKFAMESLEDIHLRQSNLNQDLQLLAVKLAAAAFDPSFLEQSLSKSNGLTCLLQLDKGLLENQLFPRL